MIPCLKQQTVCRIIRADGRVYEATNLCATDGLSVCPRVTAGCPTGTGYELCGSTHAEANCAKRAAESADVPGRAYLYGHTWICKACQDALVAVNVREFHIVPLRPSDGSDQSHARCPQINDLPPDHATATPEPLSG